ncbi:chitinase, partial [Vibrio vulnificus]
VDASASTDADNDTLTYTWQLPAGLVAQTNGAQVTFTAAEYTVDTSLTFTVTVSDGQASSVASTTVVVAKKVDNGGTCSNAWDASAVYTG